MPMPRVLRGSEGGERFLMGEVTLQTLNPRKLVEVVGKVVPRAKKTGEVFVQGHLAHEKTPTPLGPP